MADEIEKVLPQGMAYELLPYALHREPKKLNLELQARIDEDQDHDTLLFGYGLCSNGVVNLHSEKHTLVIPRVHDCISLLLGSRQIYQEEFEKCPGTIYLSKGWIDQGGDPKAEYEKYSEKYGEENARYIIDTEYHNYKRLVFIDTEVGDRATLINYSKQAADFMGAKFVEKKGSCQLLERLVTGDWGKDFVVIPPKMMVTQESFF
ncbi:MAG: DUF1638 domain-containing protein [Desulfosporosinus sp.]|nr:DUF1638 domain-containing protein [Desulfosporosinus sp.]